MTAWLPQEWCSSFVLTLGHFLWQGTLIAVLLAMALRAVRSVAARYWLSLAALLVMAVCPMVTLGWLLRPVTRVAMFDNPPIVHEEPAPSQPVIPAATSEVASDVGQVSNLPVSPPVASLEFNTTETIPRVPADQRSWWQRFAPHLTTAYLSGVAVMLLRLVAGLWGGRRLRRRVHLIDDETLLSAMRRQAAALGLKLLPVLAFCERVTVPTVVGVLKPMILLPITLTSGLSPEQVESVLAHELAHLRRRDHLVNLLQRVIESLLFFHPAMWWVSHRVRAEREHCCDDLVVACGAMPLDYAKSLLVVAELSRASIHRRPVAAVSLSATGNMKPSSLRQRIARLLGESATPSLRISPRILTVSITMLLVGLVTLIQLRVSSDQPTASASNEVASYKATLTNGATIELIGVGSRQATSSDWWRANGTRLLGDPRDALLPQVSIPNSPLTPTSDSREFAVRVTGVRQVDLGSDVVLSDAQLAYQLCYESDDDVGEMMVLEPSEFTIANISPSPHRPKMVTLRIGIDELTEEQFVCSIGPDGKKRGIESDAVAFRHLDDLIRPTYVRPIAQNRTELSLKWARGLSLPVAHDKDSNRHDPIIVNRSPGRELTYQFPVPPERLDHIEFRLKKFRHWVTFENVSLQPGQQTDVKVKVESLPAEEPKKYSTTLPNGDTVELVHLTTGSFSVPAVHKRVWWKGNGTLDVEANAREADPKIINRAPLNARLVVVRAKTAAGEPSLCLKTLPAADTRHQVYSDSKDQQGNPVRAFSAVFGPIGSEKSASLRVGIAPDPWGDWQQISPTGELLNKLDESRPHWSSYQQIKVLSAGPWFTTLMPPANSLVDSNHWVDSQVVLEWPSNHDELFAFEFRAVSTDGKTHAGIDVLHFKNDEPRTTRFHLKGDVFRDRLARFEYRLRPYRHWVSFENVSLQPGQHTDVKVIVEPIVQKNAEPPGNLEGVIDALAEKAISFTDGKVIATDAATKYSRLTDQGEQPVERKELKAGVRVRYEIANGKAATKVVILPVKQDNKQDDKQEAADAKPALRIAGRVVDAETGKVIDTIRMVPTSVNGDDTKNITWQSQYLKDFSDGRFLYETDRPWDKTRLRIEAAGYRPAITRVVNKGEVVELEIKLERKILAGVVRLPNGQPAAKAQVALATWTNEININAGKLSYGHHGEKLRKIVETDEQGRFELPAETDPSVAVVTHEAGYAEVANAETSLIPNALPASELPGDKPAFETRIIELKPWGRVEGRVLLGDKPVVGAKYSVYQARTDDVHVWSGRTLVTDAEGRFVVEHLPPGGHGICQRFVDGEDQRSYSIDGLLHRFDVPAGQTIALELGGRGRALTGKLALPEGFPHKIDWSKVSLRVSLQPPRFRGRFGGQDESGAAWSKFLQTDEGQTYVREKVAIAADGSFRIEGLPAAEYDLSVSALGEAVIGDSKPAGKILSCSKKFSVPGVASPDKVQAIDLDAIHLQSLVAGAPRRTQLVVKYEMPGAEAETRIFVERLDQEFQAKHGRRDEYGKEEYGGVRFSRLKNGDSLTLSDLPAGKYQVTRYRLVDIVREGTGKAQSSVYLDRQWIELAEQERKSISVTRPAGHPISGRVVIPADLKVNTLVVHVCSENAGSSGSLNHRDVLHFDALNADAGGKFKTEPLSPGRYKVLVEGYANHNLSVSGIIAPSWEGSAQVIVPESSEPAAIEVTLRQFDRETWRNDLTMAANELEFLKPYPKLHGLSRDMTEPQFLEIVKRQELTTRKSAEGEKATHRIDLGDGHTLIVMFDKDAKCSGIQRIRGEVADEPPATSGIRPGRYSGTELQSDPVGVNGRPRDGLALTKLRLNEDHSVEVFFMDSQAKWHGGSVPLKSPSSPEVFAEWEGTIDGLRYRAQATRYGSNGLLMFLEQFRDGKRIDSRHEFYGVEFLKPDPNRPPLQPVPDAAWIDPKDGGQLALTASRLRTGSYQGARQKTVVIDGKMAMRQETFTQTSLTVKNQTLIAFYPRADGTLHNIELKFLHGSGHQRFETWTAQVDGIDYKVRAAKMSSTTCVFHFESHRDGKLLSAAREFYAIDSEPWPKQDQRQAPPIPNDKAGDQRSDPAAGSGDPRRAQAGDWGPTANGLRARVVPVLSSMSAEAIDPAQRVTKFAKPDDVAFVVELENVSDQPIKLVDLWHGATDGKPIQDADWLSQLVCSVVLFDRDGKRIEQPEIEVEDPVFPLHDAQVTTLQPGKTQQFLIKTVEWLPAFKPRIQAGSYRAAVRYQWLVGPNAARTREAHPKSSLIEAAAVNVVSAAVAIEVGGDRRKADPDLVWGQAIKGMRAAVSFEPSKATYTHGDKLAVNLHLQNVGTQPLKLVTDLSLPDATATIKNEMGKRVAVDDRGGGLSGRLRGLLTLKPQQVVVLDAGNLGLASSKEQAKQLDEETTRQLTAPAGKYSMQLANTFNNSLTQRLFVPGQELVRVKDAWVGKVTTGATPLVIAAAPVVGVREEVEAKPAEIGAFVQLNPPPVVGDFSKVDDPDELLDQLAKSQLPYLVPQSGGGFFQQPGAPPQAMFVTIWESQYARDDKLDPRIRRLIELGDRAVPRVHQRLNGLAASDLLAAHLTLVLRAVDSTESVPVLIKLLKTTPTTVLDGTQSIDHELKGFQASVTQIAVMSALWKLTGRKHIFTPDQWEKWWLSVKPDFVVLRDRQRPEFVSRVTLERVKALANDLATNEVAARERLISLGPAALPHLLTLLAAELPKPPLNAATQDAAELSPQSRRLAWVIDELGATDKLPRKLRREYFERRMADGGTHVGSSPIDEDAFCRALSHCTFAEFCSICLTAPGRLDPLGPWGWMHMNPIVFSRRFGQQPGFVFGDPANFPLWNRVTPAAKPQQEIAGAVPVLVAALNHRDADQREMATKLADIVGLCSNEKPEALIVALRDRWLSEPEANVRVEMGSAMSRFASPIVTQAVSKGLRSERLDILGDAAAFMDGVSITLNDTTRPDFERLVELTRHENDRIRRCATRSMAYKAPQLLGPEFERLCTDKVKDIREACTLALRSNPDPKHADILFKLADDAEQTIRESAFSSIANLRHPPSMKRLLPYLRDKKVQGYAVSALADIGGEDALPLMMSELEAGNDVGGMVYQHLRRLTGEKFEEKPEPWLAWWKQKKLATSDERFPFLAQLSIPERDLPKGCVIPKVELPLQGATNRQVTTDPRAFVLISEALTEPFKNHIKAAYYSVYREEGELGVFGWAFEDAAIAKDAHQRLTAEPSDRFRWWLSGRHVICLWRDRGVTDACFEAFEKFIEKRVADARTVPAPMKEHKAEPPKTRSQAEPGNDGTLSGRFVFDGEPPVLKDPYERFANIDVNSTPLGPDAILDGAERTYRDFLTHGIRPKTADRSVLVGKDGGIANVVVWLVSKDVPWTRPIEELPPVSIRFKDGNASPRIAVVTVGQRLLIENHDPLTQTFAAEFSRALNPPASLTLPPSSADAPSSASLKFRVAEPFPAHYWFGRAPWANGRVLIHSNPFVAVSQPDGSFTLPNLPLGEWEFQVFHERGGHLSYWPKGRFKQVIKPGENSLGTIKVKPEQLSVLPLQDKVAVLPQNREQIGEVLGKPVYRDQIKYRGLQGLFFDPVRQDYLKAHQAEMTPTDAEMLFAAEHYERTIRERLKANGGEAALRERMEAIESHLAKGGLSEAEEQQLESEHSRLRNDLDIKKAATMMAAWSLTNWKGEKHLYDKFGGGRVLVGKMGHSAFDAGRRQMESLEAEGKFKITDPALRAQLFEQWTRDRGSFLKSDPEEIRRLLLGPEYVAPVGANNVQSDKVQKPSIPPKAKAESQGAIQKPSTQAPLTPPTDVPPTTPAADPFGDPTTVAESEYPVIKQISGERSDGWIACEFGLQYRVRAETTSLVAGELPLLFVDVRNRGTFKDMGLEMFQGRHMVVVDGQRFIRADTTWGGITPLEPDGKPLTLAFALSSDWLREREPKTPLQLAQGKHRIALSLMIAPVYPSPDEPQTTPALRKLIARSLVSRPVEIEIRSGAWSGPPGSLGLENIRREVIAIPEFHSPKVPPNLQRLVQEHQPAAGDFLVKLIKSDDPNLQQAASVVFANAWDSMNREQVESYLLATMTHVVRQRPQYPQGVDAKIGMTTRLRPSYLGVPVDRKYQVEIATTHFLDGQPIDEPFVNRDLGEQSFWIKTKDLPLGRKTIRLATNFTFTRGAETYRGEVESPEFVFEMVPANTPDDLIAPHDEQLDRVVREALRFADTEYELDHPPGRENFNRLPPEPPESEKWRPQIRWEGNKLGLSSLHCPVWKLAKRLPVDLCFAVEFHIENSDTRIRCDDFVSLAVEGEQGSYFRPHEYGLPTEMIKHADKDGFVTGRLVLKPSRAAALTDPKVKRYFGGEITSKPVRFKVSFNHAEALRRNSTLEEPAAAPDKRDQKEEKPNEPVKKLEAEQPQTRPQTKHENKKIAPDDKNVRDLKDEIQSRAREMSDGRMELAMKFEWPRPTPDNPNHKITTTGTARWLKHGKLIRLEYDREIPDPFPQSTRLWQEHWTTGFDGDMFYSWDRLSNTVAFGEMRWDSVVYSPQFLFWGQLPQAFEQTKPGSVPQVKRTQRDGRDVWDVSSKDPSFDFGEEFLGLAPERGFLPVHIERTRNALPVGRCELKDFFELKPGVWAAKTLLLTDIPKNNKGKRAGYHAARTEMTITKLKLGSDAQLQAEDFALRLPRDVKARRWEDNAAVPLPANVRTGLLRFVGGEKQEPLAGLQVEITHGYGDQQKNMGTFTADESGTIKVSLPIAFYSLHLKSDKELPYLPVDSLWNKESRGPRPDLSLNVTQNGVEKWLSGKKRDEGYEPPADPTNLPRITYTLLPACELTLRAVDAETGKGLPGAEFYEENAVGEDWAHAIDGQNIGAKPVAAANLTDKDGNFRRLVGANAGFKYGVENSPAGYKVVDGREVEIDIRYGQLRAEHVFKFRRISTRLRSDR